MMGHVVPDSAARFPVPEAQVSRQIGNQLDAGRHAFVDQPVSGLHVGGNKRVQALHRGNPRMLRHNMVFLEHDNPASLPRGAFGRGH